MTRTRSGSVLLLGLGLGLGLLGCKKPPSPAPSDRGASVEASATPPPAPRRVSVREGCWSDVDGSAPATRLAALTRRCLVGDWRALREELNHPPGTPLSLQLPQGVSCLRVLAVAESASAEVDLRLSGPGGESRDEQAGDLAIAPADGPRCFVGPGSVDVRVETTPPGPSRLRVMAVARPEEADSGTDP